MLKQNNLAIIAINQTLFLIKIKINKILFLIIKIKEIIINNNSQLKQVCFHPPIKTTNKIIYLFLFKIIINFIQYHKLVYSNNKILIMYKATKFLIILIIIIRVILCKSRKKSKPAFLNYGKILSQN